MYFDALTLAAVADELRATILGGRIQRVLLTGPLSIGMEVYAQRQRWHLLASAHPQWARVHLVRGRLTRGVEQATPLLLLLRKYVLGGRIVALEQPPLERILSISIVKALDMRNRDLALLEDPLDLIDDTNELNSTEPDLADEANLFRCELVIEPQDRRSNIMLVSDDNLILESVKRVTPRMSSRVVMPRQVYELPPPIAKRDPAQATAAGMAALAAAKQPDLARALVAHYRGVSPQVAREVIFRALGQSTAQASDELPHYSLAARLRAIFSDPPAPCMVGPADAPTAYAPYALHHLAPAPPVASMSAALEDYYAAREQLTDHNQRRTALTQQLGAARERIVRQQEQLRSELAKADELEQLRWEGEMIFAFLHTLAPGQSQLLVEGRSIGLDPHISPVEQAQMRFRRYDKAKSARAGLPERITATENRLAGLDELVAFLQISDDYAQIEVLAQEAEELGYLQEHPDPVTARRKKKPARLRPLQLISSDGWMIHVGRSAKQNEEVTFRIGRPDDLWLHARGIAGAHVIIRCDGREPPSATLEAAAGLAAYFSAGRAANVVEIDICRRAQVRKRPGGPSGLVFYHAEYSLRAAPRAPW
ncbi:MAG: fibronectin/fibrinogen-binding protein [Candidatus Viridilinea halotolerans]|uniref:Fibronectin/fibrinogen-binding protein n=1 Tax=Candidatus Viridilinea halotolerans TaxID=2491704 RepID=A0A426TV95_9CHLR|nr:MAG: fibronectin/fibrinogen-binding protein [Candidatus Viridilinea halotolerans]